MESPFSATVFANPHALVVPLHSGFFYAKNPLIAGGEQVLNKFQHSVFSAARPSAQVAGIAGALQCDTEDVCRAIAALEITGLLSPEPKFAKPEAPPGRRALSLWVHMSNSCNLACPYCYVHAESRGPRMSAVALQQVRKAVLATVERGAIASVTLKLAGGEPLLTFREWKHEVEALKSDLESRGIIAHLHLLTNGTVASDGVIDFITENGIGVGISIDGIGKTHDRTRFFHDGRPSFDIVARNLRKFRSAGVHPYVTAVVTSDNLQDLLTFTRFCVAEHLGFRFSFQKGGALNSNAMASALQECYRTVEEAIPRYSHFLSHTLSDLSFSKPVVDTPCGVGRSHASVNVDGALHTCQTEHHRQAIGSVFEEKDLVDAIGSSRVGRSLSRIHETCEVCSYRYLCAGGCPTFKEGRKSPFCDTFLEFIPTILRLRGLTMLYMLRDKASQA